MSVKIEIAEDLRVLDALSQSLGNVPLLGNTVVAAAYDGGVVSGFAAVQPCYLATGSWVRPDQRGNGLTYQLRTALETELRGRGVKMYVAIPNTEFERALFAKYGPVIERLAQVKEL